MRAPTAAEARRVGGMSGGYTPSPTRMADRVAVMYRAMVAKFTQSAFHGYLLQSTGDQRIYQVSDDDRDRFWSCALADVGSIIPLTAQTNTIGLLLERIRTRLQTEAADCRAADSGDSADSAYSD